MPAGGGTGSEEATRPRRPVLRGERVFLRAAERSDIPTFVRWFNDGETVSYLSQHAPLSQAAEEGWFERMLESHGKDRYLFVICLLGDGRPIGTIGLFQVDQHNGSAGMGIAIGEKELWGQGLGTDALRALLDFGFGELRLERIWLDVYDFNRRGRRSYEKCGFVLEGTKRNAAFRHGKYHDVLLMAILREQWAALGHKRSWDYEEDRPAE